MILSDFICPTHGLFEALTDADAEFAPCPVAVKLAGMPAHPCGCTSPWTPSPVAGHVEIVSAVNRGKWDPPPTATATNTRALMEGQSYGEWRKDRKKMWRDHDHKARKERG